MSSPPEMPPARRRPIPGMAVKHPACRWRDRPAPPSAPAVSSRHRAPESASAGDEARRRLRRDTAAVAAGAVGQRSDYAATRLVNFRLPVDLHDRFKALVREAEARHPRLRHPSLTEVVIALLEEGPSGRGRDRRADPPQARRRARSRAMNAHVTRRLRCGTVASCRSSRSISPRSARSGRRRAARAWCARSGSTRCCASSPTSSATAASTASSRSATTRSRERGQVEQEHRQGAARRARARGRGPVRACQRPRPRRGRQPAAPADPGGRVDGGHGRDGRAPRDRAGRAGTCCVTSGWSWCCSSSAASSAPSTAG